MKYIYKNNSNSIYEGVKPGDYVYSNKPLRNGFLLFIRIEKPEKIKNKKKEVK